MQFLSTISFGSNISESILEPMLLFRPTEPVPALIVGLAVELTAEDRLDIFSDCPVLSLGLPMISRKSSTLSFSMSDPELYVSILLSFLCSALC